jgi:uncharacterized protein YoxC
MNPRPNFQNRFFTTLETTEEVVDSISQVAGEVLNIQETTAQLTKQKDDLGNAVSDVIAEPNTTVESIATVYDNSKDVSQSPDISDADLIKPGA